jgi:hypothetical protein
MDILNEIFTEWTQIITPDLVKTILGLTLVFILIIIFIDQFF